MRKRLPAGARRRLRGIDCIFRTEAAKQRLHEADRIAARIELGVAVVGPGRPPDRRRVGDALLVAGVGRAVDRGAVTGQRARHLLIGGPLHRPRRIEARIELVGCRERVPQRLGTQLARRRKRQCDAESRCAHARSACAPRPLVTACHVFPRSSDAPEPPASLPFICWQLQELTVVIRVPPVISQPTPCDGNFSRLPPAIFRLRCQLSTPGWSMRGIHNSRAPRRPALA